MAHPENPPANRSVSIGGNAQGNIIQTGDRNTASLDYKQVQLPPPETVDLQATLSAMRTLLIQLNTPDQRKITNALDEAQEESEKPSPDKQEVGKALSRALEYAQKAAGFAEVLVKLQPHVVAAVAWLGGQWQPLLDCRRVDGVICGVPGCFLIGRTQSMCGWERLVGPARTLERSDREGEGMAADRHVQIGHDAQGNVIITGDNGRVYVFPGITALSPELLAQLDNGALTLQEEPTAVPLPSLILRLDYGDEQRTTWTITPVYPDAQGTSYNVPVPWHTQRNFAATLAGFWELSRRAIAKADELRAIHDQALTLGEALVTVLTPEDRQLLETRCPR